MKGCKCCLTACRFDQETSVALLCTGLMNRDKRCLTVFMFKEKRQVLSHCVQV